MNKQLLSLLILSSLVFTACGPSEKEIQSMIDTLSLQEKRAAQIKYDKTLLHNLKSLQSQRDKNYLMNAHQLTQQAVIPSKESYGAMHYFLMRHAKTRLNQSRTKINYTETQIMPMYNVALKMHVPTPMVVAKTKYIYCDAFSEQLEKAIKTSENSTSNQPTQIKPCLKCQRIRE